MAAPAPWLTGRGYPLLVGLLVLLWSGCSISATLNVAADGSGSGLVEVMDAPGADAELSQQLRGAGFTVRDLRRTDARTLVADIAWDTFAPPFQARTVETDGAVTLLFGDVTDLTVTVQAPGWVIPAETTGRVRNDGSVRFDHGRARLTYRPWPFPWAVLVGGPVILAGAGMLAWLMARRPVDRRRTPT